MLATLRRSCLWRARWNSTRRTRHGSPRRCEDGGVVEVGKNAFAEILADLPLMWGIASNDV